MVDCNKTYAATSTSSIYCRCIVNVSTCDSARGCTYVFRHGTITASAGERHYIIRIYEVYLCGYVVASSVSGLMLVYRRASLRYAGSQLIFNHRPKPCTAIERR